MSDHVGALLRIRTDSLHCPFHCNHIQIYPRMENASLLLIPFFEQSCYFVASENGERSFTYVDACDQYPDKLSERSNVVSLSFNNTCCIPIIWVMYRFVTGCSLFHLSGEYKREVAQFHSHHPSNPFFSSTLYPHSGGLHYIIMFSPFAQLQFHCLLL